MTSKSLRNLGTNISKTIQNISDRETTLRNLWNSTTFQTPSLFQRPVEFTKNNRLWKSVCGVSYYDISYRHGTFFKTVLSDYDLVVLKDSCSNPKNRAMFWKDAKEIMKLDDECTHFYFQQTQEEELLHHSQRKDMDFNEGTYKGIKYVLVEEDCTKGFGYDYEVKFYYNRTARERLVSAGACERLIVQLENEQKKKIEQAFNQRRQEKERIERKINAQWYEEEYERERIHRENRERRENWKTKQLETDIGDSLKTIHDKRHGLGNFCDYELNRAFSDFAK